MADDLPVYTRMYKNCTHVYNHLSFRTFPNSNSILFIGFCKLSITVIMDKYTILFIYLFKISLFHSRFYVIGQVLRYLALVHAFAVT